MVTDTLYVGKFMPMKLHNQIMTIVLVGIVAFFGSQILDTRLSIAVAAAVIGLIVYVLIKGHSRVHYLLFDEEKLVYFKDNEKREFDYGTFHTLVFAHPFKNRPFVAISSGEVEFRFDLARQDGFDFKRTDFIAFLFRKNPSIKITETSVFETYKYFMLDDSVKKIVQP